MRRSARVRGSGTVLLAALAVSSLAATSLVGAVTAAPAAATTSHTVPSPYALVGVTGAALGNMTISAPYTLTPGFSPATTDYDVLCQAGANPMTLTLSGASGGLITVDSNQQSTQVAGSSVNIALSLTPNQAIVVYSGTTQYWVRCLPPDFPAIQVNTAGSTSQGWTPGYYFTGNVTGNVTGYTQGYYAMVLDGNGVPVWYQKVSSQSAASGPANVQLLPNDVISWGSFGTSGYTGFNLDSQTTIAPLTAPIGSTDAHELTMLPNGDRMMISTTLATKDLSTLGTGTVGFSSTTTPASAANNTIVDCIVQEVNPANQDVWTWDAAQHIGVDEVNTVNGSSFAGPPWILDTFGTTKAADIYHCNSVAVDEDPASPYYGDVLVSMRHLNAMFLIDRATGNVIWKLSGTPFTKSDPEELQSTPAKYLTISGDSETMTCGQHDARFVPTPNPSVEDVSAFDDHTNCTGAARGVEYAINPTAGTATVDYQYQRPGGHNVGATGSFRRAPAAGDAIGSGSSVIGWGATFPSGYTDVASNGTVLADVTFPDGELIYRAIKVDASQVNLPLLRQTAGWTGHTIPPPPSSPPAPAPTGTGLNAPIVGMAPTPDGWGYWLVASDGGIFSYGDATFYGSTGAIALNKPIVGMAPTPDNKGYWLVASDGGIFSFGDAGFYGSTGGMALNKPIVGMAPTADGHGYWLVASDGGIFSFGDAAFYGSTGGMALNKPIVGMAPTADGNGYWLVASDGGIFSFGDAAFYGSTGATPLNKPIVGMTPSADGNGYRLVASDGGIFSFGDAGFYGSTGGTPLNAPIVGMGISGDGNGYWLVASDGGIFSYGDAGFFGSPPGG